MPQLFTNNGVATLGSAATSGATSLTLASGTGALFPNPVAPDYFVATLANSGETAFEIVKVTARSGDTLTVVRAQEGTTAAAWASGDKCELRLTAGSYALAPLSMPTYTYTGTEWAKIFFTMAYPLPMGVTGTAVQDYSGKWVTNLAVPSNGAYTSLTFPDVQGITGTLTVTGNATTNCTSLSFPALTTTNSFSITGMANLATLSVPLLTTVASTCSLSTCAAITSLSFPSLVSVGGQFSPSTLGALTTLSTPALVYVGAAVNLSTMAQLPSASFPVLEVAMGGISLSSCGALTSITFPSIATVGSNIIASSGTAALTTFTLGSGLKVVNGNVNITSAALNQASVDNILVRLAALDGTNGTTTYSSRSVTITGTSSAPSSTGTTAKATLVARGCTVTTN